MRSSLPDPTPDGRVSVRGRQGSGQLLFQIVLRVVIGIGQRAEVDADVDVDALAVLLWPGCSEAGVRGVQVPVEDCLRAGSILALKDAPVLPGGPEIVLGDLTDRVDDAAVPDERGHRRSQVF
jgi:hypothetical protein